VSGWVAVKVRYLDASALVKILVDEGDCQRIREFFYSNPNFCTTSLCFAEALGILKGKWEHKHLSDAEYHRAARTLIIDVWGQRIEMDDVGIVNPSVHAEVEAVAKKHALGLSDALQLVTILRGKYSVLDRDSASVLITADAKLAAAATAEGIRVWNCIKELPPAWA
jgi:predicted nucleic acid-binding protein